MIPVAKEWNPLQNGLKNLLNPDSSYRRFSKKDWTPAWNIWHMTRIEELTAHLLMGRVDPVLDESYLGRLGSAVRDTGNTMNPEEMKAFSEEISPGALGEYRRAVGRRTRSVLESLTPADLIRKPRPGDLERNRTQGGVVEDSEWLIDFWGRKTLGGLMMMPLTRHQVVHMNHALKLLEKRI